MLARARVTVSLALCLAVAGWIGLAGTGWAQDFSISRIAGDLYRFQNVSHRSVFLVTPEGIVVTDPINAEVAAWLKAELKSRFDLPVKYVIYSHGHADHISGGEVFADTATVVAHANAKAHIEQQGVPTAIPQETFTDRKTIRLGGKTIDLVYPGRSHSDHLILMNFRDARTVFAVDLVAVKRLPYRDFPDAYLDEWPDALKALEAMDYDILAPGHGESGTKKDVREHREYLESLRNQVAKQLAEGKGEADILAAVTMDDYRGWGRYDEWRALNVQGMVRHLK
jgi:glyoxylase-like metal-dependent hydrolase (beta-lactamase superfamily II)